MFILYTIYMTYFIIFVYTTSLLLLDALAKVHLALFQYEGARDIAVVCRNSMEVENLLQS